MSKGKAYCINENILKNYKLYNLYFKNFRAYEISLIESFYVVFFMGELNNRLAVSLGTGEDLNKAIDAGLNELNQMYAGVFNNIEYNKAEFKDYADTYFSLSTERIKKAFSFVEKNAMPYEKRVEKKYISGTNEVKRLNQKYKMNPLVIFLPLKETKLNNVKVCKVFDLNWFPSLLPKSYPKDIYNFIEAVTQTKLDRNCTYIPFP